MSDQHLFLCTIGPVQSFIAAARRTQDLYVGSRLLSELMKAGAEKAYENVGWENLLFPIPLEAGFSKAGVSHRMAFIASGNPQAIIAPIQDAIQQEWEKSYKKVGSWLTQDLGIQDGNWTKTYLRQVEHWLEFYWVAVPYNPSEHGKAYINAGKALNRRKNLRHFPHVMEPGLKCTLTGVQSALSNGEKVEEAHQWWEAFLKAFNRADQYNPVLKPNERLGAIATIKRFAQFAEVLEDDFESFPSTTQIAIGKDEVTDNKPAYFAVLHMDGDRMGERLSAMKTQVDHQRFSEALAHFASHSVPSIIEKYNRQPGQARLVYSGGDDVVALLPIWAALSCAADIRQAFIDHEGIGGLEDHNDEIIASMSAGIAIVPHNLPLDTALEEAHLAEKHAKQNYGRDAVVVRQYTGQIREMGMKWKDISIIEDLQLCFGESALSGKLGYDLLQLAHDLDGSQVPQEARNAEATRLFKRRTQEGVAENDKQAIAQLADSVSRVAEKYGWESLAHWAILARFLTQKGES